MAKFSFEFRGPTLHRIEAALARVQARLGIIPIEAADEIGRHCHAEQFDFGKLKSETERIGYPVLPVVQQLVYAMVADHERSTGPWEIEWIAVPEIFMLSSGALAQARSLIGGLRWTPIGCEKIST